MDAWVAVKQALKAPSLLQKCSWQQLMRCLDSDPALGWLTDEMKDKYAF
jgi:hypothetical protein